MNNFTKHEMLNELRTIFLFEADHILLGAGPEAARNFIGFDTGTSGEYCNMPPDIVDLSRFDIAGSFERGFDYAFAPSVLNALEEHEVQDLHTFMLGTPRAGGIVSGGETHKFMTPDGLCQRVADTVHARWKLEWNPDESGHYKFSVRELALLADMTEGAVRNALADKSENGLRAIPGSKNPILIQHAEAHRWLSGRRGFIPTPDRPGADRFLTEHLLSIKSSSALGQLVLQQLLGTFGSKERAAEALGWTNELLDRWVSGTQKFEANQAHALAKALDIEPALFLGKSLEVTFRRDVVEVDGDQ